MKRKCSLVVQNKTSIMVIPSKVGRRNGRGKEKHYNQNTSKQRSQQPMYKEDNFKKISIDTIEDKYIIDNSNVDEKIYFAMIHEYKHDQQRSHR
jgi:hypothetical protein